VSRDHRSRLFQVNTPIDAGKQHGVHFPQQRRDIGRNLHTPFRADVLGILIDARNAAFDILAASFIRGHHARARHVIPGASRAIEHLRECRHVRRIRANDADAQVGRAAHTAAKSASGNSFTNALYTVG
jgi:hypothetical protein